MAFHVLNDIHCNYKIQTGIRSQTKYIFTEEGELPLDDNKIKFVTWFGWKAKMHRSYTVIRIDVAISVYA